MIKCYFCRGTFPPDDTDWLRCQDCHQQFESIGEEATWTDGFGRFAIIDWKNKNREFRFLWRIQSNKGHVSPINGDIIGSPIIQISHFPNGDIGQIISKLNLYITFS